MVCRYAATLRRYAYAATPLRRYAATPLRRYAATPLRRYAATPLRRHAATYDSAKAVEAHEAFRPVTPWRCKTSCGPVYQIGNVHDLIFVLHRCRALLVDADLPMSWLNGLSYSPKGVSGGLRNRTGLEIV